jgi:hypothetical protein
MALTLAGRRGPRETRTARARSADRLPQTGGPWSRLIWTACDDEFFIGSDGDCIFHGL